MNLLSQCFSIVKKWFRSRLVAVGKPLAKSMMIPNHIKIISVVVSWFLLGCQQVCQMTSRSCNNGTNTVSVSPSLGLHVIMWTQPFGDQLLSFDFNAEISSIEARRKMLRMYNDHVSLYSEETNVETNAGLVVHLYRIVPHIHSTVFSTLYYV